MTFRQGWLLALLIMVAIIIGGWYSFQPKGNALDFSLSDIEGKTFHLSDFRGKVVLIDFMATWCPGCRASMSDLKAIWEKYKGKIVMISISVDPSRDTERILREWANYFNATWIHARDTANPPVSRLFGVKGIPTYVIIDKKGNVRYTHEGLTPEEVISEEISSLLKE